MEISNNQRLAELFSAGQFDQVSPYLTEHIKWNMYEDHTFLSGKSSVIEFMKKIASYFSSITTKFEQFGVIESIDRVAIYGRAEFIRESKTVNTVHSCDIYEFNSEGLITTVNSYCNSRRPEQTI